MVVKNGLGETRQNGTSTDPGNNICCLETLSSYLLSSVEDVAFLLSGKQ